MKKSFLIFTFLLNSFSNYAQIDFQLMWTGFNAIGVDYTNDGNNVLSEGSSLIVYDANSGSQIRANNDLGGCHFSPDGSKVVGINSSYELCIYNRINGALIWKDSVSNYFNGYIMSPNSNFIFASTSSIVAGDSTKLFNLNNGNIVWIKNYSGPLNISFDNTKFSYLSNLPGVVNDSIIICDLISGNEIWALPLAGYAFKQSGFSPDNNFFTITSGGNNIKIFNCNTGALVSTIPNGGNFLKYSSDNLKLFSYDDGSNSLFVYNAVTHLLNCVINGWFVNDLSNWYCSGDHFHDKHFDELSNKVAFIGPTGFAVFNTNNGVLIGSDNVAQQFSSQTNIQVYRLALSPDGSKIFTAEEETPSLYTVKMWSIDVSGVSNINNQNSFYKIYPVPVTQNLSIEIMNESKVERIELFDLQGKLLSTQNSEGKKFSLDVHSLISGTYLLKIFYDDGKIDFEKFIKE